MFGYTQIPAHRELEPGGVLAQLAAQCEVVDEGAQCG